MDSIIRGRFYQVENVNREDATLYEALHRLWEHPTRTSYEDIFGGIRVRLERFKSSSKGSDVGFVSGEFVRQQVENVPPIAKQGAPLVGHENPLGHRCAFRYHAKTNVLLLESRPNGVTPIRMDGLVKAKLKPHKGFLLSPVLTEAALHKLQTGTPRKVTFRVANPSDMRIVEGDVRDVQDNLTRMANNFGGLTVETSVGFPQGNQDGVLSMSAINKAMRWAIGNRDHVTKYQVKIAEQEEPIDIFSEQLKILKTINLENLDVDGNYKARAKFFRKSFCKQLPLIESLY